jgi:5-methylcytosine-specific restriction endonuclease McrA
MTKICTKCEKELPAISEYFYEDKKYKNGLTSVCKDCKRKQGKQHYEENKEEINQRQKQYRQENAEKEKERIEKWRQENMEKVKQYGLQYRKKNKERKNQQYQDNAEKIKERSRIYYKNNKEKVMQYRKDNEKTFREKRIKYRQENKEMVYSRTKEWFLKHPNYKRLNEKSRTEQKKILTFDYTSQKWGDCKLYFNNRCAYCGDEKPLIQEHFIPLSSGGKYTENNILPACGRCNNKKYNKDFFEWYPEQDFYSKERMYKIMEYFNSKIIATSTSS